MHRRSFMALLSAGTAGQALAPREAVATTAAPRRIVVVGGGMAGTTCAKFLALWGARTGVAIAVTLIDAEAHYTSCILSNGVLTGERRMQDQLFGREALAALGVRLVTGRVETIDAEARRVSLDNGLILPWDRLVLAPGIDFDYAGIEITARGLGQTEAMTQLPHAWKAGPQTEALRAQMLALAPGGDVVVTVPRAPYRCPPGPYERACVLADWLGRNRPGSSLIVLDANAGITAERVNFGTAFTRTHRNIRYFPNADIAGIALDAADLGRKRLSFRAPVQQGDPVSGAAIGAPRTEMTAAVVNLIPTQKAPPLVLSLLGSVEGGLSGGRWAVIDELTYETRLPGVHVIGDSIASMQPKAGHIANQQAKVCADAILRLESGLDPYAAPVTNSACYTPITRDTASWLTAVFAFNPQTARMEVAPPGVVESADGATAEHLEAMHHWFVALMDDTFG